jgi:hypothetical protein
MRLLLVAPRIPHHAKARSKACYSGHTNEESS